MAELPQSVRKRLSATQAAGAAHPDSDLLAAFTEGALLAGERDRVLAHLAVCPDCRTVVALAQPESVSQSVITLERKRSWFEWKVFRVAGALVAVAVVAVAVLMHRPQRSPGGFDDASFTKLPSAEPQSQRQMSSAAVDQAQKQDKKEENAGAAKRATATKAKGGVTAESSRDRVESLPQPARPVTRADEANLKDSGQVMNEAAPGNFGAINTNAPAPPPPVLEKSAKSTPPPTANAIGGVLNADNSSFQKRAPAAAAPKSSAQQVTVQAAAEPPALEQQEPGQQMVASQVQTAPLAMRQSSQVSLQRALAAQWRITEGGLLQRLIADQDWRTISPGGQSDFRTVASAANHVWVGGVSGLYHSADGGDHWKRIQIGGADSKTDIGEIVSIRMTSADELAVSTANGDVWLTRNGGRTWSRQQK